ncbi:MAG: LacI family DNA-binding transcriptional regulator [Rhodocyclales bacterium]|nr:LacI family DNA-binding transcriptional regulator [Rhodocyclales bacterium]
MKRNRAATLKDIAAALGVHSSTVSRVMNPATRDMVGADVAARVLETAAALGYRPNRMAASLRTRRSHTIGVVLPDITNPVFPPILLGIEQVLAEAGYVALVANAGNEPTHQQYVVEQMLARQVDGLILATVTRRDPVVERCLEQGVTVVTVNRTVGTGGTGGTGAVPGVVSDDKAGMELTVAHLTGLGHRHIAHITGPQNVSTGMLRKSGFVKAMQARGLEPVVVAGAAYTREAGKTACREILDRFPGITAVAAGNDLVAMGCYDALAEAGVRCPGDMSVVGHNDMPMVDMFSPPLTTIRIPHHCMGARAARLVLDHIDGRHEGSPHVVLQPELIVRSSTAPPRRA